MVVSSRMLCSVILLAAESQVLAKQKTQRRSSSTWLMSQEHSLATITKLADSCPAATAWKATSCSGVSHHQLWWTRREWPCSKVNWNNSFFRQIQYLRPLAMPRPSRTTTHLDLWVAFRHFLCLFKALCFSSTWNAPFQCVQCGRRVRSCLFCFVFFWGVDACLRENSSASTLTTLVTLPVQTLRHVSMLMCGGCNYIRCTFMAHMYWSTKLCSQSALLKISRFCSWMVLVSCKRCQHSFFCSCRWSWRPLFVGSVSTFWQCLEYCSEVRAVLVVAVFLYDWLMLRRMQAHWKLAGKKSLVVGFFPVAFLPG